MIFTMYCSKGAIKASLFRNQEWLFYFFLLNKTYNVSKSVQMCPNINVGTNYGRDNNITPDFKLYFIMYNLHKISVTNLTYYEIKVKIYLLYL